MKRRISYTLALCLLSAATVLAADNGALPSIEDLDRRLSALEADSASGGDDILTLRWNKGIRMVSDDKRFDLKLGGRLQIDTAFFDAESELEDATGDFTDGTEFRRARLYLGGTIYEVWEFSAEYDFAGGDVDFARVYIGHNDVPFFHRVLVGHREEPLGLEILTSNKYITFMERGLNSALEPFFNTGVMFIRPVMGSRGSLYAGIYRESDSYGNETSGDGYNSTARLTLLPMYENKGKQLVHLGVAGSYRDAADGVVRYRSRPTSHLAPYVVDTDELEADDSVIGALEAACVFGPLSAQAEYTMSEVDSESNGDPSFSGWYGMVSWFLTGESRTYSTGEGVFTRTVPDHPLEEGGPGAWEVAARYSELDLSDGQVSGGEMSDTTLALNWYPNANIRWMLNYGYADVEDAGSAHIVQARVQIDF